jgi:hypothetical protein
MFIYDNLMTSTLTGIHGGAQGFMPLTVHDHLQCCGYCYWH